MQAGVNRSGTNAERRIRLRPVASGVRLVQDFLLPKLDCKFYGELLQWIDRNEGIFKICFEHKANQAWTESKGHVFRDWSILKRRWNVHDPQRHVKAKQRFRAALRKVKSVHFLKDKSDGHYRVYKILNIPGNGSEYRHQSTESEKELLMLLNDADMEELIHQLNDEGLFQSDVFYDYLNLHGAD